MVTVYTRTVCQPCRITKKKLTELGVDFGEINTEENEEAAEFLRSSGFTEAPVVVTPFGSWSGLRPDKISELADKLKQVGDE